MASFTGQQAASAIFNLLRSKPVQDELEVLTVEHKGPTDYYLPAPKKASGPYVPRPILDRHIYSTAFRPMGETVNIPTDHPATSAATTTRRLDFAAQEAAVRPTLLYSRLQWNVPELVLNYSTPDRIVDLVKTKLRSQMEVRKRVQHEAVWGDGSGVFATVQLDSSGSSVQLQLDDQISWRYAGAPGARFAYVNRPFRVYRGLNGAQVGTFGYVVTDGTQWNPGAGTGGDNGYDTITFTPAVEGGQEFRLGDVLVEADFNGTAFHAYPNGFRNIYDDGTNALLYSGINRSETPRYGLLPELRFRPTAVEGSEAHFQRLTHPLVHRGLRVFKETTGAQKIKLCARSEVLDEFVWESILRESGDPDFDIRNAVSNSSTHMATQMSGGPGRGPGKYWGGYDEFTMLHPDFPKGGVTIQADYYAPYSTMLGFDPSDLEYFEWAPWQLEGGWGSNQRVAGGYRPDPDQHNVQAMWFWMGNLHSRRPSRAVSWERIRRQHDAVRHD